MRAGAALGGKFAEVERVQPLGRGVTHGRLVLVICERALSTIWKIGHLPHRKHLPQIMLGAETRGRTANKITTNQFFKQEQWLNQTQLERNKTLVMLQG